MTLLRTAALGGKPGLRIVMPKSAEGVPTMLISHRYRFIFIKTRKTAGTSVEVDLSKIMGEEDVVTPIIPSEDGHVARNYQTPRGEFYNHIRAKDVRKLIGRKIFNRYFKFCIEREPVDKSVSHYFMLRKSPDHNRNTKNMTWSEYIQKRDFPTDQDKYTDMFGGLIVDRILRYEELGNELAQVADELSFPFSGLGTKAKAGFREEHRITREDRRTIYDGFRRSLKYTGYRLD